MTIVGPLELAQFGVLVAVLFLFLMAVALGFALVLDYWRHP